MRMERRDLAVCGDSNNMEGRGEMTKAPINLQDLRRSLYVKAKAEPAWRFWGLYIHVCKMETLQEAYRMAKSNNGAPGIDGVTFEAIEESGAESLLRQIREELVSHTYRPMRARKKEIPKDGGKVRVLSIPAIRDRVVQGALKLILEPIFEADSQAGSYGYRPKRTAHEAVARVAQAIVEEKTRIIDLDLKAYFDNVQHYLLLEKLGRRIQDDAVLHLLKMILKATGKKGVPQGGVITPLTQKVISNLRGYCRGGGLFVRSLTCAVKSNMFMTDGPVDQSRQGSTAECSLRHDAAQCCLARGHAALIPRVRPVRTSSLPLPGGSDPSRPTGRSFGSCGTDHAQAPCGNGAPSAGLCQKQWPDHRGDRDTRVGHVSRYSEKAWLRRANRTARFRFTLTMHLIACTIRSSSRPTVFWCPLGSVPLAGV